MLGIEQQFPDHLRRRLHVDVVDRVYGRRFRIIPLGPDHMVIHRSPQLLEQVLEDEGPPTLVPPLHELTAFRDLAETDRRIAELLD